MGQLKKNQGLFPHLIFLSFLYKLSYLINIIFFNLTLYTCEN